MDDRQEEIMLIAQEECAEVIQAISKCFRFGLNDVYEGKTNLQRLEEELGDLKCMIDLMEESRIISGTNILCATLSKRERLRKWSNVFNQEKEFTVN
jgi:hypothetical protein